MITECEDNLLTACEQTCNNLFADLLQAVRFYVCNVLSIRVSCDRYVSVQKRK